MWCLRDVSGEIIFVDIWMFIMFFYIVFYNNDVFVKILVFIMDLLYNINICGLILWFIYVN